MKKLDDIIDQMYAASNNERAIKASAYLRNKFRCLGLDSKTLKNIISSVLKEVSSGGVDWSVVHRLYSFSEREFHYTAIYYLKGVVKDLTKDDMPLIQNLITTNSWWDSVDSIVPIVSEMCKKDKDIIDNYILPWAEEDNIWLRRVSILFQLSYKRDTDFELLKKIISLNLGSKEFFINKAIGWALRAYARYNEMAVKLFVYETVCLDKLSVREAMKHIKEK